MSPPAAALLVAAGGAHLAAAGALGLRIAGAQVGRALRLGGSRQVKVGDLVGGGPVSSSRLRLVGRIRCGDPLHAPDDERLVAFHRDVEVELPRVGWRTIDRIRETRSFDLWDHAGALTVDPAAAAEPLVTIPRVWEGPAAQLDVAFQPAIARLTAQYGAPLRARSLVRSLSLVDRLIVVARVHPSDDGGVRLAPPPGGYLITNLDLDAAMRLLAGPHRRLVVVSLAAIGLGASAAILGIAGATTLAILGA